MLNYNKNKLPGDFSPGFEKNKSNELSLALSPDFYSQISHFS